MLRENRFLIAEIQSRVTRNSRTHGKHRSSFFLNAGLRPSRRYQRARSDEAHVASDYVEKLREFVQLPLPQKFSEWRYSRIGRPGEHSTLVPTLANHRPEFQNVEFLTVFPRAPLAEQYGSARSALHHERDQQHEWKKGDKQKYSASYVETTLPGRITPRTYAARRPRLDFAFCYLPRNQAHKPPTTNSQIGIPYVAISAIDLQLVKSADKQLDTSRVPLECPSPVTEV
jgi:hypothetical protein